jgi:hypothetical protein
MKLWLLIFYLPVLLVFLAGVWQATSPLGAWKLRRLNSRAQGLATADAPEEGALRVIRWQGLAITIFALGFAIMLAVFFRGFEQ